jgi:hypothetical protein
MFIDAVTRRRVNIYTAYKGFSRLDTESLRLQAGVIEIPEPQPPNDYSEDTYIRIEVAEDPYVIYTKKSNEDIARIRKEKLKAIRDELTEEGGCLVQGKWFHTDVRSKQQQLALLIAGANLPSGLMWKTMDGTFIQMTEQLAIDVFQAQLTRESLIFGICEIKQNNDTPLFDGWPARYIPTGSP